VEFDGVSNSYHFVDLPVEDPSVKEDLICIFKRRKYDTKSYSSTEFT
jgi:hypothetical protein